MKEDLNKALMRLTAKEKRALELNHGMGNGEKMELEKVGQEMRITGERARQIIGKANRKLSIVAGDLQDYLKD